MSVHVSSVLYDLIQYDLIQLVISVTQSCSNYKLSRICFYLSNQIYPINFLHLMDKKRPLPKERSFDCGI